MKIVFTVSLSFHRPGGSTALGFEGIGGSAMTKAMTTVVLKTDSSADVYFGTRLAYHAKVNERFMEDLNRRNMCSQHEAKKHYELK